MDEPAQIPRKSLGRAWLVWCVFVAYGSLVPFDWRALTWEQAADQFARMPWLDIGLGGRLDWLANLLLYVPAGFLGTLVLAPHSGRDHARRTSARHLAAACLALLLSTVLAMTIEALQIFVSPRTVSLNDIAAEIVGALIGCVGALVFGRAVLRLLGRAAGTGPAAQAAWLMLYLLAYLALSFFPFDFSEARAVHAQKLASGHAGWWWAPYQQARPATGLLKLALEAVLVLPFGLVLATRSKRLTPLRAFAVGLMLGAVIEVAQLFLLGAVSQGASAVSRAMGIAAGAALAPHWPAVSDAFSTRRLRMFTALLALPWLLAVAYLAGWGRSAVTVDGWHQRAGSIDWLPFVNHYYAGEAQALTSVLQAVASYGVVGMALALCWPRARGRHGATVAGLFAGLAAGGLEASKLLLAGQQPDPTHALVAAAAAVGGWALTRRLAAAFSPSHADPAAHATAASPASGPADASPTATTYADADAAITAGEGTSSALVAAVVIIAAAWAAPGHALAALAAIVAFAACVWRHPPAALLLVPVAVALTDTAAITGHRWLDTLDLIMLATLLIALLRPKRRKPATGAATLPLWPTVLCGLLFVPGVLIGLRGATWPDPNALLSPLSPWHALWLAKGLAAALIMAWFVYRLRIEPAAGGRQFGRGMVLALAGVVFLTVRERLAFVGPFDFSSDYRAPGPFSAIALGGAYIEAFLVAATPFAVIAAFRERLRALRWASALLVLAAAYTTMVTYSRGGQVVFLVVLGAAVLLLAVQRQRSVARSLPPLRWPMGAVLLSAVAVLAGTILMSPYATTRFKQLDDDVGARRQHWAQGLDFGRDAAEARWFGNGLGSFGRESYVQGPPKGRPSVYLLEAEAPGFVLRAHPGSLSYLDQRVDASHGEPLTVSARLRVAQGTPGQGAAQGSGIEALLCEKDLVQSRSCGVARLRIPADGQWHQVEVPLTLPVNPQAGWPERPVRFTLFNGGRDAVDIDDIALRDRHGRDRLRNGGFADGAEHWLYSSDKHLVWHMKNFWLQAHFEHGLLGLAAHTALLLAGLAGAWRATRSSPWFLAFGLSLLAMQGVGLIDSVIDSPRFWQLYLMLALLAWTFGSAARPAGRRQPSITPPAAAPS